MKNIVELALVDNERHENVLIYEGVFFKRSFLIKIRLLGVHEINESFMYKFIKTSEIYNANDFIMLFIPKNIT